MNWNCSGSTGWATMPLFRDRYSDAEPETVPSKERPGQSQDGNLYYLIGSGYLENGQEKEALPYMEEALRYVEDNALFTVTTP